MSGITPDLLIGIGFIVVFATYGVALRQRLATYRDAMRAAGAELERRRVAGLATGEAEHAYNETAEALNALLERFPSNVMARLMKISPAAVIESAAATPPQ